MRLTQQKHYDGCYRFWLTDQGKAWFGQVKRDDTLRRSPKKWSVEFRWRGNGQVARYGGLWPRLRDAREEVAWLLENEAPSLYGDKP